MHTITASVLLTVGSLKKNLCTEKLGLKTTAQARMALVLARMYTSELPMSVVEISHVFFVLFESKTTFT